MDQVAEKLIGGLLLGIEVRLINNLRKRVRALVKRAGWVFAAPSIDRAIAFNALSKFGILSPTFFV